MKTTGSVFITWNARDPSGLNKRYQARRPDRPATQQPGKTKPESQSTNRHHAAIKCRACGHPVTGEQFRIEVAGRHGHRVNNPHSIEFLVGCFSQADGCLAAGNPYRLHSWFRGYQWQIALCRQCGAHLGWYFSQTGESPFYALIFNRMTD
ncbi:MAG: hypothetical protein DRQ54_01135 [Gammaproteobacteria bacterium]|nr:MAG: hypothetical protein DRQ54_01135 [Gammaproteobacteria bacterium]RLA15693.1 MAG: hypothetical protein DRQ52_01120 [Gammaproteobacteria bacterium]